MRGELIGRMVFMKTSDSLITSITNKSKVTIRTFPVTHCTLSITTYNVNSTILIFQSSL